MNVRARNRRRHVGTNINHPKMPNTVGQLWGITDFLGQGSFGAIYKGVKLSQAPSSVGGVTVPGVVAIKFESIRTPYPQLASEKQVIQMIHDTGHPPQFGDKANDNPDLFVTSNGTNVTSGNIAGFPHYYYYGIEGEYYCLAMTLLGKSLYNLFEDRTASRWTFSTVAPLGIQMLDRIEVLHKKGYIHRDIKPDNFLIGTKGKEGLVTMIDFGLAKTYRTSSGAHQPADSGKQLTGTARYASITAHKGMEQSRRDDLEALMYCLVFFLLGRLPWQGLKPQADQTQKYGHILKVKEGTPIDEICRPTGSTEIFRCLKEVRSYAYNQRPRYSWIRNHLICGLISRMPIYRCVKTQPDRSVVITVTKLNEGFFGTKEKVPQPDWTRSEEWCNAVIQLETKFMNNGNGQYKLPKLNQNYRLPFIMGYPGESIKFQKNTNARGYKDRINSTTNANLQSNSLPSIPLRPSYNQNQPAMSQSIIRHEASGEWLDTNPRVASISTQLGSPAKLIDNAIPMANSIGVTPNHVQAIHRGLTVGGNWPTTSFPGQRRATIRGRAETYADGGNLVKGHVGGGHVNLGNEEAVMYQHITPKSSRTVTSGL